MARIVLKHKTALILGAECPAGRAVALQLTREGARVILSGHDGRRLRLLAELIQSKGGDPAVAELSQDAHRNNTVLMDARDDTGNHFHYIVNAAAAVWAPADDPGQSHRRAHEVTELVLGLVLGRGNVRLLTLWPGEGVGAPPTVPDSIWHSLVRINHLESAHDEAEPTDDPMMVKAAGAADAVVYLLCCPPSACPVAVTLEPRAAKSR